MFVRRLAPLLVTLATASTLWLAPAAVAAPAGHRLDSSATTFDRHACTRTSSGKCIRGGQFCPRSKYRKSGWDAKGRRYVCKGDRSHPHWMKP
jgi:hypothetical protein